MEAGVLAEENQAYLSESSLYSNGTLSFMVRLASPPMPEGLCSISAGTWPIVSIVAQGTGALPTGVADGTAAENRFVGVTVGTGPQIGTAQGIQALTTSGGIDQMEATEIDFQFNGINWYHG